MINIYEKLFNLVFSSSHIPETWTMGKIRPIYKNKGDKQEPDNYRPITILSCLGKLFTSVLNARLMKFIESNKILGEEQLGFRNSYSTIDGAFILHSLLQIMKQRNKSTYAAFIDLKKAFPSVSRPLLLQKLSSVGIGTKMYHIILSMYKNVKSYVSLNGMSSEAFECQTGLREGECLSPLLFSLYVNDLCDYLKNSTNRGVNIDYKTNDIVHYFHIFLLMYADDTVLFADTKAKLQSLLTRYEQYCNQWKLDVNTSKTKIVIFGKNYHKPRFLLKGEPVEVVNNFKYLGIIFSKNGRLNKTLKENVDKARKAFYLLMRKCKQNCIPLDCQVELFQTCIEPILLYGCEIWGIEKFDMLENFRLKCFKMMFKVRASTPAYMLYGELGLLPLKFEVQKRMLGYWGRLVTSSHDKIAHILYKIMLSEVTTSSKTYMWITCIENIICKNGFGEIWFFQQYLVKYMGVNINRRLYDVTLQQIKESCGNSNKGKNYLALKGEWTMEEYIKLLDTKEAINMFKFKTGNHKLPVETGRYNGTEYKNRICHKCSSDIGDEFHYVFKCPFFELQRERFLHCTHIRHPSMMTFINLLRATDKTSLSKLAHFISLIMNSIRT